VIDNNLAVLKSLAVRPSREIAPSVQPLVIALLEAGHVSYGPDGWTATAQGCHALEELMARCGAR
jgi:hypothetical protein